MASQALSEYVGVVGWLKPQLVTAAATGQTDVIDMRYFHRVMFLFLMGDYAAGDDGSLAAGIYGDAASDGSFATLITGKSLTVATFTGSTGDAAIGILEVNTDEVEAQSLRYIRGKATPTNENQQLAIVALGGDGRYDPASDFDLAAVHEIIR